MKDRKYLNYIAHYQADAEGNSYFQDDAFNQHKNRRRYEFFKNIHPFKKEERVLEVGSGGGYAIQIFRKNPVFYIPLDIPQKNLKNLRQAADFELFPLSGDTFYLPLKDNSVDVVVISEVLEHLEEPAKALQEIQRVLKSGNEILISVPYKEKISFQLCVHCNQWTPNNAHFHSFDEQKISEILGSSGFELQKVSLFNNRIMNRLGIEILLRKVPFGIWRLFDKFFNLFGQKASHMVVLAKKYNL